MGFFLVLWVTAHVFCHFVGCFWYHAVMNITIIITLLGLTAAISWGVSDFLGAKSAKSVGPVLSTLFVNTIGVLLFVSMYALFLHPASAAFTPLGIGYSLVAGSFLALGGMTFFKGLEAGPVSIVSPLSSTYPIITTAIAILVFQAHLNRLQFAGVLLTVLGVVVASGLLTARRSRRRMARGPSFALLAALLWGVGFASLAQAAKYLDWQSVALLEYMATVAVMVVLVPFIKGKEVISLRAIASGLASPFILGASLTSMCGFLAINFGISQSTATGGAIITAVSACYPILTIVLALKHFDEKVEFVPLAGAVVGIAGIVVLSIS